MRELRRLDLDGFLRKTFTLSVETRALMRANFFEIFQPAAT